MFSLMNQTIETRDVFLKEPLVRNCKKLLNHLKSHVAGAIVVGHKMSGKSQMLAFLEQLLLHQRNQGEKVYVAKASLIREGDSAPPINLAQFYRWIKERIIKPAGLVERCKKTLGIHGDLKDALKHFQEHEYESMEYWAYELLQTYMELDHDQNPLLGVVKMLMLAIQKTFQRGELCIRAG